MPPICGQIMVTQDGNVVNLATFRKNARKRQKTRDKQGAEIQAAANRVRFGRRKGDKKRETQEQDQRVSLLEGHRLNEKQPADLPDEPVGTDPKTT